MSGYLKERYKTDCTDCGRTIKTRAPKRNKAKGVMIRCSGTDCDCDEEEVCDCEECNHINFTREVIDKESDGALKGGVP